MIFLSAQPDTLYSKWQLEVQLFNFKKMGIAASNVHVLIGCNPKTGLNPIFNELFDTHHSYAQFFVYEDNRYDKEYQSTIRPHIIKQHFLACPYLNDSCIFYHDADIIFRDLPDFDQLCQGPVWQLSNTRGYIGSEWIKKTGRIVLEEMCLITNKDQKLIEQNDLNAGGAQYVMKNVNYQYWERVEVDCAKLYHHLKFHESRYAELFAKETGKDKKDYNGLIAWCADMWAVLWNAWEMGFETNINSKLDFCWPKDNLTAWEEKMILHNAGFDESDAHSYFYKGDFRNSTPYNISLDYVIKDKCTIKYVEAIRESQEVFKIDLSDVTFLIPIRIDTDDRLQNLYTITKYIHKYFKTNIILLEADKHPVVDRSKLPPIVKSVFIEDHNYWFHRTRYNNQMISISETPIVVLYDADVIVEVEEILNGVNLIRKNKCKVCIPYDGTFISIYKKNQIMLFANCLEINILKNTDAFVINKYTSCGGAVILDKANFIKCGKENEGFHKWGPEDIERVRRLDILGYPLTRTAGKLYHLDHEITPNSGYTTQEEYFELMKIHVDMIGRNKTEIIEHIKDWKNA